MTHVTEMNLDVGEVVAITGLVLTGIYNGLVSDLNAEKTFLQVLPSGSAAWSLTPAVYLWGTNLLDDQYELGLFDGRAFGLGGAYGRMADPRAVGAGIDVGW